MRTSEVRWGEGRGNEDAGVWHSILHKTRPFERQLELDLWLGPLPYKCVSIIFR